MKKCIIRSLLFSLAFINIFNMIALTGENEWTPLGPEGGIITSIAISPNFLTDNTVFCGTKYGEIYKSINGGSSWESIFLGPISSYGYRYKVVLAISPNYQLDQTIFAATTNSVFKSTNGGHSWNKCGSHTGNPSDYCFCLTISPDYSNDHTIFLGTPLQGVLKSKDAGVTWIASNNGLNSGDIRAITCSPNYASDKTLFLGKFKEIYKSENEGNSWKLVKEDRIATYSCFAISPSYRNDGTVLAGSYGYGIDMSTDYGMTWIYKTNIYPHSLAFSLNYSLDSTIFLAAYGGLYVTRNGMRTWEKVLNENIKRDILEVKISPSYNNDKTIFLGSAFQGIIKSENGGFSWEPLNNGIFGWRIFALDISDVGNNIFTSIDDGGVWRLDENTKMWKRINNGLSEYDIVTLAVSTNYIVDSTLFCGTECPSYPNFDKCGLWKSINGGAIWSKTSYPYHDPLVIAISPNYKNDKIVLVANAFIYRSENGGNTWRPSHSGGPNLSIFALKFSPSAEIDRTVFLGTKWGWGGIYRSNDFGLSWSNVLSYQNYSISSITVSPSYPEDSILFVGTGYEILKSIDKGENWFQTSNNIPPIPGEYGARWINDLAISPTFLNDQLILAATRVGIYISTNGGNNWFLLTNGLPEVSVEKLALKKTGTDTFLFYAGTYGNGIWQYQLSLTNTPPESFRLIFPSNEDTIFTTSPLLLWEKSEDNDPGDKVSYILYYSLDSTFTIADSVSNISINSYNLSNLNDHSTYFWKVKAIDNKGAATFSKQINHFITFEAPLQFGLLSPAHGDTVRSDTVFFSWHSSFDPNPSDTVHYTLRYDVNKPFIRPKSITNINDTTFTLITNFTNNVQYFWTVLAFDKDNFTSFSRDTFEFYIQQITSETDYNNQENIPQDYAIYQNYPNPFNPTTTIKYQLPRDCHVTLKVFNALGQEVATLLDKQQKAGSYSMNWDATGQASGVYFIMLQADEFKKIQKMLLLR